MIFYLIGFLFISYEIDKFFRSGNYGEIAQKAEAAMDTAKNRGTAILTRDMKGFLFIELAYLFWSIIGIFSDLRWYFIWILIPPMLGIILGKAHREGLKERRKEGWYIFVTCILFGVIPLGFILYYAWFDKIPF
ncbi:MAG: hypothetical protein P8J32_03915 [bacterium]|nr:hypothetical protein [bacterium]